MVTIRFSKKWCHQVNGAEFLCLHIKVADKVNGNVQIKAVTSQTISWVNLISQKELFFVLLHVSQATLFQTTKYMYVMWRLCWGRAALIVGQSYYESISLPIINYQQRNKHMYLLAYRNHITLTMTWYLALKKHNLLFHEPWPPRILLK